MHQRDIRLAGGYIGFQLKISGAPSSFAGSTSISVPDVIRYLEAALQTTVKYMKDSVGPDGLVPTVLVYGALPRLDLPNEQPSLSMFKRANELKKASAAMTKHINPRQTRDS